jgi:hypothetical protein
MYLIQLSLIIFRASVKSLQILASEMSADKGHKSKLHTDRHMYRVLGGKMKKHTGMQYESAAHMKSVWTHYDREYLQLLTCQRPSVILH